MAAAAGEDAASLLSRAVHAVFAEWTALGMAVENEWGGRATRDKALQLLHRVLTGLLSSSAVHVEELEELLDSALLDDFNVEAEDDSPAQVARLLCTLHSEARAGCSTTALGILEKHASKREQSNWVVAPLPPKQSTDSSDDEDIGEDGDENMAVDTTGASGSSREPKVPEVDEDGFQMVSRSRGRR